LLPAFVVYACKANLTGVDVPAVLPQLSLGWGGCPQLSLISEVFSLTGGFDQLFGTCISVNSCGCCCITSFCVISSERNDENKNSTAEYNGTPREYDDDANYIPDPVGQKFLKIGLNLRLSVLPVEHVEKRHVVASTHAYACKPTQYLFK